MVFLTTFVLFAKLKARFLDSLTKNLQENANLCIQKSYWFCARALFQKFVLPHTNSSGGKGLNSISRERLNFRRWPICVQLCIETFYKQATSVAHMHLTNFSFEFFMQFSNKMPLYVFYTMVQKSRKWPKTQIKGVLPWGERGEIATRTTFLLTAPLFFTFLTSNFPHMFVLLNFILWFGSFKKFLLEKEKYPKNHSKRLIS